MRKITTTLAATAVLAAGLWAAGTTEASARSCTIHNDAAGGTRTSLIVYVNGKARLVGPNKSTSVCSGSVSMASPTCKTRFIAFGARYGQPDVTCAKRKVSSLGRAGNWTAVPNI